MIEGRKHWRSELRNNFQKQDHPTAWFHCASLGEFEQGRPIIERFSQLFPNFKILLTFYSPSGYEVQKDYAGADYVCYLPWDTPANAKFFISTIQPRIAFFIKYEYWYHLLNNAHKSGTPVLLCAAIFRPEQIFFKWHGGLFRKILHRFHHLFIQDQISQRHLQKIGVEKVTVAGDTRIDRVLDITQNARKDSLVEKFVEGASRVMIIGSSWPPDLKVLAPIINNQPGMKFIIAPHEVNDKQLGQIQEEIQKPLSWYTKGYTDRGEVLVIDTVGILSHLYQYGDLAYVGGAFGKGLHNIHT